MRKILTLILLLMLIVPLPAALATVNLLYNGDFSLVTDGLPDGWTAEGWQTEA